MNVKLLAAAMFLVTLAGRAQAETGCCCAHCGCHAECQKVCRLVCEEKKVEVFCWGCKCEEFCVPGPCKPGCQHCETVCGGCDVSDPAVPRSKSKRFIWLEWLPGYAKTYSRTKLMRKTVTVTVPSHKWVIEDMCSQCASRQAEENAALVAELPQPIEAPKVR